MNPISQGLNNISAAVGNISTNVNHYVSNKKLEQSRDARISLYPPPPVSNANLGGKIINGVFGVTIAPLMLPGYAPVAAYKNSLVKNNPENQFKQLINLPELQQKKVVEFMMKLPKAEQKNCLKFMSKLPESELKEVVDFMMKIPESGSKRQQGLEFMMKLPESDRKDSLELMKRLPPSESNGSLNLLKDTVAMLNKQTEAERKDTLDLFRRLPLLGPRKEFIFLKQTVEFLGTLSKADLKETVDFLKELSNFELKDGFNLLGKLPESERKDTFEFIRNLPESEQKDSRAFMVKVDSLEVKKLIAYISEVSEPERKDIYEFTRVFEGAPAGGKTKSVDFFKQFLAKIPQSNRAAFSQSVLELSSEKMDVSEKIRIAESLIGFSEAQRGNLPRQVRAICEEGVNGYRISDLIEILKTVPEGERENLADYILQPQTDVKTFSDLFSYFLHNPALRESLFKPEYRQALLQLSERAIDAEAYEVAEFMYNNRTVLELNDDNIILQKAFLHMPSTKGINVTFIDPQNLDVTDAKADDVAKRQFEEWNILRSTAPKVEKTKVNDLGLEEQKEVIELRSANVTEDEAIAFQQALGEPENPGEIGKFVFIDKTFKRIKLENEFLENGNILYPGEHEAIRLYTSANYLLLNGTLNNDPTSINLWKARHEESGVPVTDDFVAEAQKQVIPIAEVAISGINKLPAYEGLLYRGDAMSSEKLEEYRQGKVMMAKKFLSCSTNVGVCEKFAKEGAKDYIKDTGIDHKAVLFVFKSESAKDIKEYSLIKSEEERIYTPGQGFRTAGVDEKTIPGLAIIYMEELK